MNKSELVKVIKSTKRFNGQEIKTIISSLKRFDIGAVILACHGLGGNLKLSTGDIDNLIGHYGQWVFGNLK